MTQFDVYLNPNADTRDAVPCLLDVQSDLLDGLATRVVVPLIAVEEMAVAARDLNPQFRVKSVAVVMSTAGLAGVSARSLGDKVVSLRKTGVMRLLLHSTCYSPGFD